MSSNIINYSLKFIDSSNIDYASASANLIKNMDALPDNAKKYIFAVEDFIGAKVSSVSTSPERDDTILVENPFDI